MNFVQKKIRNALSEIEFNNYKGANIQLREAL